MYHIINMLEVCLFTETLYAHILNIISIAMSKFHFIIKRLKVSEALKALGLYKYSLEPSDRDVKPFRWLKFWSSIFRSISSVEPFYFCEFKLEQFWIILWELYRWILNVFNRNLFRCEKTVSVWSFDSEYLWYIYNRRKQLMAWWKKVCSLRVGLKNMIYQIRV